MKEPLQILMVEDHPDDAELLLAELRRAGFDPTWKRVDTEPEYMAELGPHLDIIFSDFALPQFSTPRALTLLLESKLEIPFIIVSGTIGEERAVESMKAGATDYVLKDRIDRLGPVVKRALREARERRERKIVEAQFVEAQKMEVVGHLASGVAHDFNNILGVIMGYGDLMTAQMERGGFLHKCAEEIQHAAERAAALTRQLLVFSRKETVLPVVLDLNQVIEELDKMLHRLTDENIEMTILPGEKIGNIQADSGYLGQLLMNLVVNARDAMPHGGKITIQTSRVSQQEASLPNDGQTASDSYVMVSVSDTGTGMTNEVKARLFEAFFTTKPKGKGTGLGLATCHTIVRQSGGQITVESELGVGTTFRVYFPAVDLPLEASAKPPEPMETSAHGTETLLLVEDEPSVRHLASSVLESQGYTVLRANNGQDGLNMAREHKGTPISLVVTDVVMPQMSGKVMAEWLQATYPDIKVLFTSGYSEDSIAHHGVLDAGVAFLPKPYTPGSLIQKVREMLDAGIKS